MTEKGKVKEEEEKGTEEKKEQSMESVRSRPLASISLGCRSSGSLGRKSYGYGQRPLRFPNTVRHCIYVLQLVPRTYILHLKFHIVIAVLPALHSAALPFALCHLQPILALSIFPPSGLATNHTICDILRAPTISLRTTTPSTASPITYHPPPISQNFRSLLRHAF